LYSDYGFLKAKNSSEASSLREFSTYDIVRRLGVISPTRVHLKNHPIDQPVTVFNAALAVKDSMVHVYARIILGYYMYVSGIAKITFPIEDLLSGLVNFSHYTAELILYPTMKYDIWGVEDPRVSEVDNKLYMVYVGRTINYFNPAIRRERTAPVLAYEATRDNWVKTHVFIQPKENREHVISDKDAFIYKVDGKPFLFHRLHMDDEQTYLVISEIPEEVISERKHVAGRVVEVVERKTTVILDPAPFELKLGWAGPPVKVGKSEYLFLIHGVDKEMEGYRVFAALMEYSRNEGFIVKAVTPYYIMEPRQTYEVFGDRPNVVFPCGSWLIDKDIMLITYGAADYLIGFGTLSVSETLSLLDKGRIY